MKTLWGSCNTGTAGIWLNLELAKKPPECLEYVVVHELIHLLERHHNARFMAHMDDFLPNWQIIKQRLNALKLGVWCKSVSDTSCICRKTPRLHNNII